MANSILLWDRVRLPDGREGAVIGGDPESGRVTVSLIGGGAIEILAILLTPIPTYSRDLVDFNLRVELDDALKMIERISVTL